MKKIITIVLMLSWIMVGCNSGTKNLAEIKKLKSENESLKKSISQSESAKSNIATFLTFQKEDAEQAMNFYVSLFDNSKIVNVKKWEANAPGKEGTIMHATFTLNGKLFMCSDSPPIHAWDFSPAVSNYVDCKDESELENLYSKLSEKGEIMMPLANYGFSQKFGWVVDQFGVSWQINLK